MNGSRWSLTNLFFLAASVFIIMISIFFRDSNTKHVIVGAVIIIIFVVIDMQAPKIARLSSDNPKIKTLRAVNRIAISTVFLVIIYKKFNPLQGKVSERTSEIILVAAISLFMMVFGNLAPKIPFNRYVGIRLPWTIRDEETWKLAHKVAGFTAFPIAIIQFALVFFFKAHSVVPVCILIWIAIPGLYSGWFFLNKFKKV